MNKLPFISVIVPVYKVEPYLSRCIDSILAQTFTDFELILVDDGSPDNCGKICDSYAEKDGRIHVIHRENGGLSAARNSGIDWAFKNSNSKWLSFIDSDDWVHPDYLDLLLLSATTHNADISICEYEETTDYSLPEPITSALPQKDSPENIYVEKQVTATIAWGKLYNKNCFKDIRYPVGKLHEDEFVTYKILFEQQYVSYLNEKLYYYFSNSEGIIRSTWSPKRLVALDAFEEQIEYFRSKKYDNAYRKAVFKNLRYLVAQIQNTAKSSEHASIHRKLKKELKKQLKKYKCEFNLSLWKHSGFYEVLYPRTVKLFGIITGVKNRIKKVLLCHKSV